MIIDENGQVIKHLINGSIIEEGSFQLNWDGKDYLGNSVSAGNYRYIIEGEYSGTRQGKITYLK